MSNFLKNPALLVLGVLLAAGLPPTWQTTLFTVADAPTTLWVSIPFALGYLAIFFLLFRFTRIWPGKPYWWLVLAVLWGAIGVEIFVDLAGGPLSTLIKQLGMPMFSASLAGALPEEIGKFLGVFLIAGSFAQIDKPWRVFVVALFVGLGFTLIEDVGYAAAGSMLNPTSDVAGALTMWVMRSVAGFGLHSIYTALATWGLARSLFATDWSLARRIAITLAWFLVGFALHFIWNSSPADPVVNIVKVGITGVVAYGLFLLLFLKARKMAKLDAAATDSPSPRDEREGGSPRAA